ncbi:MAG: hypothetical protein A2X86_16680 [Bdellovibrionales bacterium GWA2_49_15]|nr:MAG: hypothetical protein A2X86_16680 [Bdellovibrionales bacterium GWA2_49_15]
MFLDQHHLAAQGGDHSKNCPRSPKKNVLNNPIIKKQQTRNQKETRSEEATALELPKGKSNADRQAGCLTERPRGGHAA